MNRSFFYDFVNFKVVVLKKGLFACFDRLYIYATTTFANLLVMRFPWSKHGYGHPPNYGAFEFVG
jgi:hypothetical protein